MTRSLLFLHARPGCGDELLRVLERLGVLALASEQAGFLGVEVLTAADDTDEIAIVESWASRRHYERWRDSPVSGRLLEQIDDLVTGTPVSRVYHVVEAVR